MAKLTAGRPILYQNRIYKPGETLPGWDAVMAAAWLEAGSAVLDGEDLPKTAEVSSAVEAPASDQPAAASKTKSGRRAAGR